MRDLYLIQLLSALRKHLVIGQFSLLIFSHSLSLVTVKRQTSYDSGILCQDCGTIRFHWSPLIIINQKTSNDSDIVRQDHIIVRGLLMNHTKFADRVIYRKGPKREGHITASDQTMRAVHGCNSWLAQI